MLSKRWQKARKEPKLPGSCSKLAVWQKSSVDNSEAIMSVLEKKQDRSKAKTAVTLASRRLIGAVNRDVEYDVLKNLMTELEKAYDDFWVVNEEFELIVLQDENSEHRTVNGESVSEYRDNVKKCYEEAKEVFLVQKADTQEISKSLTVEPVRIGLRLQVRRIGELLEVIESNINTPSPNMQALQLDQQDLQSTFDTLCGKTSVLSLISSSQSSQDMLLQDEINDSIGKAYSQLRSIKLYVQECQNTNMTPVSVSKDAQTVEIPSTNVEKATSSSVQTSFTPTSLSNTSASNNENIPAVIDSDSSSTMNVSASEFTPTTTLPETSVSNPYPATSVPPTLAGVSLVIPQLGVNMGQASFDPGQTSSDIHQHPNTNTLANLPPPVNPNVTTSPQYPGSNTMFYPSTNVQTTIPPLQYPYTHSTLSQTGTTTIPSTSSQSLTGLPQLVNSTTSPSTSNPWMYPAIPIPCSSESYTNSHVAVTSVPQSVPQYPPTGMGPRVQVKKMSLPTFNGHRKEWPEFKAIWKSVAETAYFNKTTLAHELKRSVKGEASKRIRSVYITKPEAYDVMWQKLESYYEDVGASVQAALEDLHKLKEVSDDDYKGLVEMVDEVESAYCQLDELGNLNVLTMRDVDFITELLPSHLKVEWRRKYRDMSSTEKVHPFIPFMKFLEGEREAVARIAEIQPRRKKRNSFHAKNQGWNQGTKKYYKCAYPSHRKDVISHTTEECKEFHKLPVKEKYELLKQVNACFRCFGNHQRRDCLKKDHCSCGNSQHHQLLCEHKRPEKKAGDEDKATRKETHVSQSDAISLYPIYQAAVCGTNKTVTVFCDGGSNATYITHRAAERIKAKKLGKVTLDVTTMGNVEQTHHTQQYQFTIPTNTGKKVTITAYGMERITGPVSKLDDEVLKKLFPEYEPESLQRKSNYVDILLGCDYFGFHPKREEARCGDHLSIMKGELGVCIQGTHPELFEGTKPDSNLAKVIHDVRVKAETYRVHLESHPQFMMTPPQRCPAVRSQESPNVTRSVHLLKDNRVKVDKFIVGEELGTETTPRCGGCRCGKCPIAGHTYSFKEEQELKIIRENLEFDKSNQCWITSYPWVVDPNSLPDNYNAALRTLEKTEHTLLKDEVWAHTYKKQIEDMVQREVARPLTTVELQEWNGPFFYISHLAVLNPKSNSTPVRIIFNSSQVYQGVSLNSCLAKGPDCYMNNLIGILLRWREEAVALVGDIRKMFNSVYLKEVEKHCHRFLWRDLEINRPPDIYIMERVNMGDTPAPAISTEAIYKTANRFEKDSSEAAKLLNPAMWTILLIHDHP